MKCYGGHLFKSTTTRLLRGQGLVPRHLVGVVDGAQFKVPVVGRRAGGGDGAGGGRGQFCTRRLCSVSLQHRHTLPAVHVVTCQSKYNKHKRSHLSQLRSLVLNKPFKVIKKVKWIQYSKKREYIKMF